MCKFLSHFPLVLVSFLTAMANASSAPAQDFRMESWVFRGKEKDPVSESLTLFQNGVVYDFVLPDLDEITVFDPAHGKFVLLDCRHGEKAILNSADLLVWESSLRTDPEFARQAAVFDPKYKESYDASTKWLTLASDKLTYRARLLDPKPDDAEIAKRYRKFADWYSRLNAYKGNLHTLARLPLNRALADRGTLPEEVELSIQGKLAKIDVRSRHLFNWVLAQTDLKRIDKANTGLADFKEVALPDFKPAAKVAAKAK